MAEWTRGSAAGQFELTLDSMAPMLVKSVEGGLLKGNTIEEQVGTDLEFIKHISTLEIEPLSFEMGAQNSIPVLRWIQQSWRREYARMNGEVRHGDAQYNEMFSQTFKRALISEVTFPGLDGAGKDTAMIKIKIQPEEIGLAAGDKSPLFVDIPKVGNQKLWSTSCFRLTLDNGVDVQDIAKIDGFTVKQGLKAIYFGGGTQYQAGYRVPEWEPTKITFPDVSVHMSLHKAQSVIKWYEKFVIKGDRDPKEECSGAIEYLAPDKSSVVFRIKLMHVGIKALSIDKSERTDQTKRVKFDLYVGKMDIDDDGGLLSLQ